MLKSAVQRISAELPDGALVLDVGGWASPLPRADWVLDLFSYETRGLYGSQSSEPERFTERTWIVRDMCDREPWPFEDGRFDFAVCAQTLEDVRDPIWVCQELIRVARAGYIECPAPLQELTWGVHGTWVGWSHHRWICEREGRGVTFTMKPSLLCAEGRHLPAGSTKGLTPEELTVNVWWDGSFPAREQVFVGPDKFDPWLDRLLERCRKQAVAVTKPKKRRLFGR